MSKETIWSPPGLRATLDRNVTVLRDNSFSYLLFLPTLLFLIIVIWYPFVRGIWISFHDWPFIGDPTWIGLGNYEFLWGWEPFFISLRATVIYATTTFLQLVIALAAALAVANLNHFRNFLSGVYLLPYTMPPVVTGTIWMFLLDPSTGPLFSYLTDNGVLEQAIYWASNGPEGLTVITLVIAWTFWPFMFLILLASRQNIPDAYYESAKMYGANRLQMLWKITLPQMKSAILVAVSIRFIWNLSKISQPLQMTGGGPGYDTSILAILLYRFAFLDAKFGVAYAVGVVLFVISLLFVGIFIREFEKEREAG